VQYLALAPHTVVLGASCLVATLAAVPPLRRGDRAAALRSASRVLLVGTVLTVMAVTLLGTTSDERYLNLVPGAGIAGSVRDTHSGGGMLNVFGNVVLFMPVGFLTVVALRRRVVTSTAMAAALSLLIETCQYVLGRRWADIDDLLLNTLGALLGAVAAAALTASWRRRHRSTGHP
jgi:glycopeptide antibiotics resistance protein